MSWILPGPEVIQQFKVKGSITHLDPETHRPKQTKGKMSAEEVAALNKRVRYLHKRGKSQKEIMEALGIKRTAVWAHLNNRVKVLHAKS